MRLLPALALTLLLPVAAMAQTPSFGPALAPPPPQAVVPANPVVVATPLAPVADDRVAFNNSERWLISYYFDQVRQKQKRAARQKRYDRTLPAGLTSEPQKGDLLPQPVMAQLHRLPGPLLRELPPARPGTDRVIAGKTVLMVTTDGRVLDVLPNILF